MDKFAKIIQNLHTSSHFHALSYDSLHFLTIQEKTKIQPWNLKNWKDLVLLFLGFESDGKI